MDKPNVGDIAALHDDIDDVICIGVVSHVHENSFMVKVRGAAISSPFCNIGKDIMEGGITITPREEFDKICERIKRIPASKRRLT